MYYGEELYLLSILTKLLLLSVVEALFVVWFVFCEDPSQFIRELPKKEAALFQFHLHKNSILICRPSYASRFTYFTS